MAASYELLRLKSLPATSAIANQFLFVKLDTNGGLVLCGSGDFSHGVTQDKPAAGDPTAFCSPGDITKVLCGGTFTAGQDVMSDASGQAVVAASSGSVL